MNRVDQLLQRAEALGDHLRQIRRDVHARPELGFEERATHEAIVEALDRLAPREIPVRAVAGTGVLATLREGRPSIVIRACMDALPVQETTGLPFASTVPGVSHACGHDGQVAVLVGALALLAEAGLDAGVFGLFQPAEEIDTGARAVLDDQAMNDVRPDVFIGFHGHPGLPAGSVAVMPGPVMASITTIRCEITGRTGHGAEPHLATDAVTAAALLVLGWQVALGRRVDPRQPVVLSVGRIAAGSTPNVIPGSAELEGTLRSLDPGIEDALQQVLVDVARGVEAQTATEVSVRADRVVPAVVNDPSVTATAASAAAALLGRAALVDVPASLGGDDFAWYLQRVPGCYVLLGEGVKGREPYGWHDAAYDLDERSLPVGSALLAAIVQELASSHKDLRGRQ